MHEQLVGTVTHYYGHPHVAAVTLTDGTLTVGEDIHIVGHTSDFTQRVESMEINHAPVAKARPGESVGIRVLDHAREHDKVYRVLAD